MAVLGITVLSGIRPVSTEPSLLIVPTALYSLYLCYSAARLAGGAIATETEMGVEPSLQMVPVGVVPFLVGKLIGSLLPLYVEVAVAAAVLCMLSLLGWAPLLSTVALGAYLFWLVTWFGLWGLFWSCGRRTADHAVGRARLTVNVLSFIVPMFSLIGLADWHLPALKLACLGALFLNPLASLYAFASLPSATPHSQAVAGAVTCLLMSGLTAVLLMLGMIRRLSRV